MRFFALVVFFAALGHGILAQCRHGWKYFGESCYGTGDSAVTFAAAQEICQFYSAKLTEIETAEENNFLKSLAKNLSVEQIWIGGTDIFNEGSWYWLTSGNAMFEFLDWPPSQPDNQYGDEDCLSMSNLYKYQWNDYHCSYTADFFCEGEAGSIIG